MASPPPIRIEAPALDWDQARRLLHAAAAGIRPDPHLDLVDWAELHYELDTSTSARPGAFRVSYTPYLREPMQRLSAQDTEFERVVLMFGAQLGKTTVGLAWTGYNLHQSPSSMLVVMPTVQIAEDHSRTRIDNMIRLSPALSAVVPPARSRDGGNATLRKQAPGAALMLAGANAPAGLSSKPIRRLILDEIDRYPKDAGGEGSPIALAVQRTSAFYNRKIFMASTPTLKRASAIEFEFEQSNQCRYHVPCPRCGGHDWLRWEQVRFDADRPRETAHYVCPHCQGRLENHEKAWMLPRGQWIPGVQNYQGNTWGGQLSSLYSPVGQLTWGDLAKEFVTAARARDATLLQAFTNTKLAQTWEPQDGESHDKTALAERAEPRDWSDICPDGVVVIVAGVDIQADRIELELVGVGRDDETWSLAYQVLEGDTSGPEVWDDLDEVLAREWEHETRDTRLGVALACIDAGYRQDQVAHYCAARPRTRAIIGREGDRPIWPRAADQRARARRRSKRSTVPVYTLGVDTAKERLFAQLGVATPGPSYCHFPAGRAAEYWTGLLSEYRRVDWQRGRRIVSWRKVAGVERNEPLDCRVYAIAALFGLRAQGLDLARRAAQLERLPARAVPLAIPCVAAAPTLAHHASSSAWAEHVGDTSAQLAAHLAAPIPPAAAARPLTAWERRIAAAAKNKRK